MTRFVRSVAAVAALFVAGCNAEAFRWFGQSEASAAASTDNQGAYRVGNKGPFGGRTDGVGFDTDNYGPGIVSNGELEAMFNSSQYVSIYEDFLGWFLLPDIDGTDLAQGVWAEDDTATAGCPARKGDFDNGAIELLLDNGNEVGDCDLNWGNELNIDSDTEPFCVFRIQYQVAPVAADTLAWGFYAAQADLLSSFNTFAAFSVAGADNNLDVQSDDATTDVNATDSTVDMTAGTFIETMISMNSMHGRTSADPDGCSATDVCFFYRTSTGGAWTQILPGTVFSVGADLAMQPFVHIEKTSGTSTPDLLVDYIRCAWQRE